MNKSGIISRLADIGIVSTDSEAQKQQKQFLVYMGLIMSMGGIVWGSITLFFSLYIPSAIPYGYTVLTVFNFLYLYKTKDCRTARNIQMVLSILLPFLFQWSLGGFISSGAIMMWATLSLIASLSFQDTRSSIWWLVLFLALNLFSAIIEPYVNAHFNINLPVYWTGIFFFLNISIAVAVIFVLVVYFINVRDRANNELDYKNKALKQSQTQLIQSEKLAVLGQLIAGVAHEVNTPLGAIQASVGIIGDASSYIRSSLVPLLESLTHQEKELLLQLLSHNATHNAISLSAKEERMLKRELISYLEDHSVNDADAIADTLVDIGVYSDIEKYLPLFSNPKCEQLLQAAYNIVELNKNCENIKTAVERASKVVFALKNYSHRNNTESKLKTNIPKGLETVLMLYHNQIKKGITVNKTYDPVPEVMCYPDELNQVWTNIIHNAIQAMDNKGVIDIAVGLTQTRDLISVKITDSGKGIPEEIRERIFEPFFTTKPPGEGSGLGLDIVQQIVKKHGGDIVVDSIPGKTTFDVRIPVNSN